MTGWTDAELIHDAQLVFKVMSGRWTLPVLAALEGGPRRHGDLRRAIDPIHPKVFNQTLRRMTDQRLLTREVRAGPPPAVFYALAQPARLLIRELDPLLDWVGKNPSLLQHWRENS
jgi:DNA-binding HxlR family transcriptional regulator